MFINAAKTTLTVKNKNKNISKNWKKRKKTKEWFDNDCKKSQNQVRKVGKQKHLSPHDSLLREKYHEKLREYKRTCRSKKYFYTHESLNNINSALDDPTSFWTMWKFFGETDTNKTKMETPGNKLFSHYSHSVYQLYSKLCVHYRTTDYKTSLLKMVYLVKTK